jgi:hypothetical protein
VEVDVERDEVDQLRHVEVLGRGEVRVADERRRRARLHLLAQHAEEVAHALGTVPADDVGRDLVADQEAEQGRVAAQRVGSGARRAADLRHQLAAVEEAHVLRPGNRHQHAEPVRRGAVEQPAGRHRERPQAVDPRLAHERQVALDQRLGREREPVPGGGERPVGDAAQVELAIADEEELAADRRRRVVDRRGRSRLRQRT